MFFHPKILARDIIKEIDKLEGELYESFGRLQLCLPQDLIEKFPLLKDREKLTDIIWNFFYDLRTYEIDRYCFTYQDCKFVLSSYKKEWELEIKAFVKQWEGENEITLISPSYKQFEDPELIKILNPQDCQIIKFPKTLSK